MKNSEKERSKTERELDTLKTQISQIQKSAGKNSNDAQEAIRVQEAAKVTAQSEVKSLRQSLIILKTKHNQMTAEWRGK